MFLYLPSSSLFPLTSDAHVRGYKVEVSTSLTHQQEMTGEHFDEMHSPESLAALIAPRDENALLLPRREDSSLRPLRRFTGMLFRVRNGPLDLRNGALTLRDVKNEGRTDYVYENTGNVDKMSCERSGFLRENAPIER
jgi:hypothetical protein